MIRSGLIFLLVLCGGLGYAGAETLINGAGATFPYPLYTKWISAFTKLHPNAKINYQSIGSGGGIRQVSEQTVDFGASDAPMTDDEMKQAKIPILHLPTVIGAVVIAYNTPGVSSGLNLTRTALAGIFLGRIRQWNDPEIARANPKTPLPKKPIIVVHRSDGSGTTAILTDYLSKISPEWKKEVGAGKAIKWPVGIGGKGNEGVAGTIQRLSFSIGYIEKNYAAQNKMTVGRVENKKGKFVAPDLSAITTAASAFEMPPDFRIMITDPPVDDAYPISGFTWLLIPRTIPDAGKKGTLLAFLKWMLREGQSMTSALYYAPLPKPVASLEEAALAQIQ